MSEYGRGTYKHMLAVAKKKKPLQNIINNISSYTIEELDNIQGQPAWIRKHLVKYKQDLNKKAAGFLTPEQIAEIMIAKSLQ